MAENEPDCSEGCRALSRLDGTVKSFTATTDLRVKRVEEGVSNYIKFMAEARDFFTEHRIREQEREKQLNLRDQEIKDALAQHNQEQTHKLSAQSLKLEEMSVSVGKRGLAWNIAAVMVAFASLCAVVLIFIIGTWVVHHSSVDPLQILQQEKTGEVYTVRMEQPPQNARMKR